MAYGDGLYGDGLYGGTPVSAIPQTSVFPPRVLVSVVGLVADSIASVTIFRIVGTTKTGLRGAIGLNTTGVDAVVRTDGEEPFGVPVQYVAELTSVTGVVYQAYSAVQTISLPARYALSDAINALGAAVVVEKWPDKKRTRAAATFNVNGRMIVVSKPRSNASATIEVRTDTTADGDAVNNLLNAATSGVVLLRGAGDLAGFDAYLAIPDDSEDRLWWEQQRWWKLEAIETEAWAPSLEARGFTLGDIATVYMGGILADIANDFLGLTLLAIAQAEFVG